MNKGFADVRGDYLGYATLQPEDPREIGPYKLLGQLGSGGMGQVFLGMSAGGRPIAVKIIRTELASDPDFRARFRREVAAAQKVSGLFTALVVDADLDGPMPWLATAYVAGPSLTETVRGHGPLPVRSLLGLAAGLAEGLHAIHHAGVVHRDLKPSNVLLAEDGPRVIDFGISEAAEASAAAAAGENVMIGSPGYMSPEQVLAYDIGPASDMFSLGAVLTFAATGQGPFGSGSSGALMYRLVNMAATLDDVPAELRPLVGRCLAKHPGDRPTASELLAEVGALQPAPGWLAESIMNSFAQTQSAAAPAELAEIVAPTGTATSAVLAVRAASSPPPRQGSARSAGSAGPGRPGRHRISRPLASACLTGGLAIASAVAAFALIGAGRTPAAGHAEPQAAAGNPATAPALAAGPSSGPGTSPSPSASLSPSSFLTPAGSRFSTTLAPTPISPTPSQPAGSGSGSGSAQPTKSAPSSSAPPSSAPPSSTPPSSAPPSSTPPSSTPPSSTPPSSTPPSSTPPSSTPPSSTPPSSTPPSSAPPSSTPPSSDPPSSASASAPS
jgi:eukaryotic-like serine/threonine-protein kinase